MCCKGVAVALAAIVLLIILCSLIWVFVVRAEEPGPYLERFDDTGATVIWEDPPISICGPQYNAATLVVGNLLGEEHWSWSWQSPCMWENGTKVVKWHWDSYLNGGGIFYPVRGNVLNLDGSTMKEIQIHQVYYVNWNVIYIPGVLK